MVHSMAWNDLHNMLAALVDGNFSVWMYPNAAYVDKDLLAKTVYSREAGLVFLVDLYLVEVIYRGVNPRGDDMLSCTHRKCFHIFAIMKYEISFSLKYEIVKNIKDICKLNMLEYYIFFITYFTIVISLCIFSVALL